MKARLLLAFRLRRPHLPRLAVVVLMCIAIETCSQESNVAGGVPAEIERMSNSVGTAHGRTNLPLAEIENVSIGTPYEDVLRSYGTPPVSLSWPSSAGVRGTGVPLRFICCLYRYSESTNNWEFVRMTFGREEHAPFVLISMDVVEVRDQIYPTRTIKGDVPSGLRRAVISGTQPTNARGREEAGTERTENGR